MIKEYFREYYHSLWIEKNLMEKLTEKKELLYYAHGIRYSDEPKVKSCGKDTLDKIEEIHDLENRLNKAREKTEKLRKKHLSDLKNATSSHELEEILILCYLERKKNGEIAKSIGYSSRQVIRMKRDAEKELETFIDNKKSCHQMSPNVTPCH